jgi:hypothetical protein
MHQGIFLPDVGVKEWRLEGIEDIPFYVEEILSFEGM